MPSNTRIGRNMRIIIDMVNDNEGICTSDVAEYLSGTSDPSALRGAYASIQRCVRAGLIDKSMSPYTSTSRLYPAS